MRTSPGLASLLLMAALATVLAPASGAKATSADSPWLVSPPAFPPVGLNRLLLWGDLQAMRTFFERVDVLELAEGVVAPGSAAPPTVRFLSEQMSGDWQECFRYVRDRIDFVPYSGAMRGARGSLEAGAGNSLDQSLLLRALLARRGERSRLVRGRLGWSDAAELVLGTSEWPEVSPGDPWPRWVESAAEHWWLEVEIDGRWIALDPSFSGAAPDEVRGRREDSLEELPDSLFGQLRIEILHGDRPVTGVEMKASDALGAVAEVFLESVSAGALGPVAAGPDTLGQIPVAAVRQPTVFGINFGEPQVRQLVLPEEAGEDVGPWILHLVLPGGSYDAGPFNAADLASLSLRVTVDRPLAPPQGLELRWGDRHDGRLALVLTAGPVSSERLAAAAAPLYRSLQLLAAAEVAALEAMRPPLAYAYAAESLRRMTSGAWLEFSGRAPATLGWALLSGLDRVSSGAAVGRVLRPGLRLVAVRWDPPGASEKGSFAVRFDDPIVVGQLAPGVDPASLQSAYGLLQSAVASQILHRMAGQAPQTAFDVTLRAVGTGQNLQAWRDASELPVDWPRPARDAATADLRRGFAIVSPDLAPTPAAEAKLGWWSIVPTDGTARGWVMTDHGRVQGTVAWEAPVSGGPLDEVLAALPALHRSLRWLANLRGNGGESLATVPSAACASAAVAAETMSSNLPESWPRPEIDGICGGSY